MSNEQYKPTSAEERTAEEMLTESAKEMSITRERILARLKTAEGGASVIMGARELGVPEEEIKAYALRVAAADARRGFDLGPIFTMARNTGVATEEEVDAVVREALRQRLQEFPGDAFAAEYVYGQESEEYHRAHEALAREEEERAQQRKWSIQTRQEERDGERIEYRTVVLLPDATFEDLLEAARSEGDETGVNLDDALRALPGMLTDAAGQEFMRLYMYEPNLRKTTGVLDFFKRHGYSQSDVETGLGIKFLETREQ